MKNRLLLSSLLLLFSCEHFFGRILNDSALVVVPGFVGRWKVTQENKVTSILNITLNPQTKTYLVEVEGDFDRSHLRFAKIDGNYIGEYHDVGETGEEVVSGHIFLLRKTDSGWKALLGSDITKQMVTKHKLVATAHKRYGKNPQSYFLSGNESENTNALGKLITDPEFFRIRDEKKAILLNHVDGSTHSEDPVLKEFISSLGNEIRTEISEFETYYEIQVSRKNGGAEKYKLDKKTGKSSMLWHEHPNR